MNVVAPRQMGKSSLIIRAQKELQARDLRAAYVDLQGLGTQPDAMAYFRALADELAREFELGPDASLWWNTVQEEAPGVAFRRFLVEAVLALPARRIVIFLDEIDTTLKYPFTDDLFLAFRYLYNERARDPDLQRLAVCLIGVAMPNELVKDRRSTPYNVGRTLFLRDFDGGRDDLSVFLANLGGNRAVLDRILHWSGGQPFLVARMVDELGRAGAALPEAVDRYVEANFSALDAMRGQVHFEQVLRFVETRLSQGLESLSLYGRILSGESIAAQTTPTHLELELAGLVKRDGHGKLILRNPIYARLFDRDWLGQVMPQESEKIAAPYVRELQAREKAAGGYRQLLRVAAVAVGLLLIPAGYLGWQQYEAYRFEQIAAVLAPEGYELTTLPDGLISVVVNSDNNAEFTVFLARVFQAGIDPATVGELKICESGGPCALHDPERLDRLTRVRYLSLASLQLTDVTPLKGLTALQDLRLQGNQLTTVEPLKGLIALQSLNLSSNQLTAVEPLKGLTALQSLFLSDNQLTTVEPLKGLTALQTLYLRSNQLTTIEPLQGLTALQTLDLAFNQLKSVESLRGLTGLQALALSQNQLTTVESLKGLTALLTLYLGGNQLTTVEPLAGLTSLQTLTLGGNRLTTVEPLKDLTALQTLLLMSNQLTTVEPLHALRRLEELWLDVAGVADFSLLLDLTALKKLFIPKGQSLPPEIEAALKRKGVDIQIIETQ